MSHVYGICFRIWLIILYATDSKSQFYIIDSIDVYSLSAVYLIVRTLYPFASGATAKGLGLPLQDPDLVCKEQDKVRELDAQDKTGELAKKVGRIISRSVKKVFQVSSVLVGVG